MKTQKDFYFEPPCGGEREKIEVPESAYAQILPLISSNPIQKNKIELASYIARELYETLISMTNDQLDSGIAEYLREIYEADYEDLFKEGGEKKHVVSEEYFCAALRLPFVITQNLDHSHVSPEVECLIENYSGKITLLERLQAS